MRIENTCGYSLCANNVSCPDTVDTVAPVHPPLCVESRCVAPQPAYVDEVLIEPAEVSVADVEAGTGMFTVTVTIVGDYGEVDASASTVTLSGPDVVGAPSSLTEPTPGTLILELPYSWLDGVGSRTYDVDVEIVTQYETLTRNRIAEITVTP